MSTLRQKRTIWAIGLLLFWGFIGRHIFDYFYTDYKRGRFLAKYPTVATIGNSGGVSNKDFYGVDAYVKDTRGGGADLGYGAVNGYPGASASISIGVPQHIEASWGLLNKRKEGQVGKVGFEAYYRINADIDSELAKKKIETLQNYYKNFGTSLAAMQVSVNKEKIYVFFTLNCYGVFRQDCTPNENADPYGYIMRDPDGYGDVVMLFEGEGEVSDKPFKGTSFDSQY